MGSKLSEGTVNKMLRWYIDDMSITNICEQLDVSRQTFYNYRDQGVGTDGEPWDEYKKRVQREEQLRRENDALEVQVESTMDMVEDVVPDLKQACARIAKDLRDGTVRTDASDLDKITTVIRRLENQGAELQERMQQFKRKVAFALYDVLSERKADLVVEKVEQVELETLQEYDAQYVEGMLGE